MAEFDRTHFEDQLYTHGLAGFKRLQENYPKDDFYSFAFYTCGELSYVAITANSYEGLDQVAPEYKKALLHFVWVTLCL